jgi:hypothetical protein
MAQVTPGAAPTAPTTALPRPSTGPDWTVQAADTIESVVGTIRDKTVVPATTIARGLVYGIVAGTLGIAVLVLVVVMVFRMLVAYLPWGDVPGRNVWVAYLILGGIFTVAGLFFLRRANAGKPASN